MEDKEEAGKIHDKGDRYYGGYIFGIGKNMKKAFECYKKAAEMGFDYSQFMMARFYEGRVIEARPFVKTDLAEAVKWYTKAAEQGHKNAHNALDELKAKGKI